MVVLIFLVVSTTFKDRLPAIDLALPDSLNARPHRRRRRPTHHPNQSQAAALGD